MSNKWNSRVWWRGLSPAWENATVIGAIYAASLCACTQGDRGQTGGSATREGSKPSRPEGRNPIDEAEAIAIAREYVEQLSGSAQRDADAEASQADSGWRVKVSRRPAVPGGSCVVLISPEGKVQEVIRGE